MKYVKRESAETARSLAAGVAGVDSFPEQYPALWEYLTLARWEDGRARETSTLLFFVEEGAWKGCLNDRALGRSCWAAGPTQAAVMASLEAQLAADCAEWRRSKSAQSSKKRAS